MASSTRSHPRLLLLALAVTLSACPEESLEDRCIVEEVPWTPGMLAFRDSTEDWGLGDLMVTGHQVNVMDLDGDGWSDLIVHNEGGRDDFGPDGERSTWVLRNTGSGFEDVTEASNFRVRRDPEPGSTLGRQGTIMASADVDNDGDMDVYTAHWAFDEFELTDWSEVVLNDGTGHFSLGPERGDHRREGVYPSRPASVAFTDYDRDGWIDLWMVNNGFLGSSVDPDFLFAGNGDGSFDDVSEEAGLGTVGWLDLDDLNNARAHSWGWAAAACDLNDDGIPELLAASYGRTPNHLWRGELGGDGRVSYVNESVASGYAFDGNQDWTDDVNARCYCADYPDEPDCDLADPPPEPYPDYCNALREWFGGAYRWDHNYSREPMFLGGVSGTTNCVDMNNDGRMDLLTSEIRHPDVGLSADSAQVMLNTGSPDVRFERLDNDAVGLQRPYTPAVSTDEGVMNNAAFDFDNDGWQDVWWAVSGYPGNHGHLYRQVSPSAFEEVDASDGIDHYSAHNSQAVDVDRDGDLDLLVGHMPSYCGAEWGSPDCYDPPVLRLYENLVGSGRNWLQVDLEGGAGTNRAAIGARVEVADEGSTQAQEVDGGHGRWSSQRDRILHFGLGSRCSAEVTVRWPDAQGSEESFELAAGYRWKLVQGEEPVPLAP